MAVKVTRAAVHVGGRYRKLGRNISNSPWIPGKCVSSVQVKTVGSTAVPRKTLPEPP